MGQNQAAVFELHAVLDHIGVNNVIIVTGSERVGGGRVGPPAMGAGGAVQPLGIRTNPAGSDQVGRVVAIVETHVRHGQALLQDITAAREIGQHGCGFGPPGGVDVEVFAGMIHVSWHAPLGRGMREGMERDAIQPVTKRGIGQSFVFQRPVLPVPPAGKRLGIHNLPAVNVCGRGRLFHHPELRAVPELAARYIHDSAGAQRFGARLTTMSTLGHELHSVSVKDLPGSGVMAVNPQVAYGLAIVVLETGGDLRVGKALPLEHGQVRNRVIATPLAEFRHKGVGPIRLIINLDAVDFHVAQCVQARPHFQDLVNDVAEMAPGRITVKVINDQSVRVGAGHHQCLSGIAGDKPRNHPGTGRNIPGEQSIAVQLFAEVYYGGGIADGIAR